MKLVKAMATVAGMTGLSRIAGFTRDVMTAAYLGAVSYTHLTLPTTSRV